MLHHTTVLLWCMLNSWGSGSHPWGIEKDPVFSTPNHWDGLLEVVGVTGVVHMGKITGGLSNAKRLAQGAHVSQSGVTVLLQPLISYKIELALLQI